MVDLNRKFEYLDTHWGFHTSNHISDPLIETNNIAKEF